MSSELFALFEKLGLTEYEAKTLGTLFKLKEAEAPDISRLAQVPKTRVYDVLEKLILKNLIIEIKGRPKLYRTIDPQKAIDSLIQNKKNQLVNLEQEALDLKDSLIVGDTGKDDAEKVMKVKDKQDFDRILGQELLKANTTIHGMTEITDDHDIIHEALNQAKKNNVSIKLLNASPCKRLKESSEVKHFAHGLNVFILDSKKIILAISDFKKDKPEYHFVILNEHTAVANALMHFFNAHWDKGKKY